jgi:hypothetical protein
MANPQWPSAILDPWPINDALRLVAPKTTQQTEMDGGNTRIRRRFTSGNWQYDASLIVTNAQCAGFLAWRKHKIDDGARVFDLPVWTGEAYVTLPARMLRFDEPVRAGNGWRLTFRLQLESDPVMSLAAAQARWPGVF